MAQFFTPVKCYVLCCSKSNIIATCQRNLEATVNGAQVFDLLLIVEANGEQFPTVLALLFPSKERVEAEKVNSCPFGGIVQNGRKHRRCENRFAFVLPDECDRDWVFAGNGYCSDFGIEAILHKPMCTIAELSSFVHYFIQQSHFLLYIFCQYLLQEGDKRQLCSLLLCPLK